MEAATGPKARPSAPNDLYTPITMPFWLTSPYFETKVVRQGTTTLVERAYRANPTYKVIRSPAKPILA